MATRTLSSPDLLEALLDPKSPGKAAVLGRLALERRATTRPSPVAARAEAVHFDLEGIDLDAAIQKLPKDRQLAALIGFSGGSNLEERQLQGSRRLFGLLVPRQHLGAARGIIGKFALPCSGDFVGEPRIADDGDVFLTGVAPGDENAHLICQAFQTAGIPGRFVVREAPTLMLKPDRGRAMAACAFPSLGTSSGPFAARVMSAQGEMRPMPPSSEIPQEYGFDAAHASVESVGYATREFRKVERGETRPIPREGPCVYLMIDMRGLQPALITELNAVIGSSQIYTTSYNGFLILVGLAAKASSSFNLMALQLLQAVPDLNMRIGRGEVKHLGDNQFGIEGFPSTTAHVGMRQNIAGRGDVYLKKDFSNLWEDPKTRESTLCRIKVEEVEGDSEWVRLVECRAIPRLTAGGPDNLVGMRQELDILRGALRKGTVRLIVIDGTGGVGKSKLVETALAEFPVSVVTTLEASLKAVPGYGLLTVVRQIVDQMCEDESISSQPEIQALFEFDRRPYSKKSEEVRSNPARICEMCLQACCLLNAGRTPFVMDDFHLADSFSLQHFIALCEQCPDAGRVPVLIKRPEEEEDSKARQDLETDTVRNFGSQSVVKLVLSGLNLKDPALAYEYVKRYDFFRDIEGKDIGDWYREVGEMSGNLPIAMNDILDFILRDPQSNLDFSGNTIELTPACRVQLERLKTRMSVTPGGNIELLQIEALERLPEQSRQLLQCLALMKETVSFGQARFVVQEVLGIADAAQVDAVIQLLIKEKLLLPMFSREQEAEGQSFRLKHETLRAVAIDRLNPAERVSLAKKLYAGGHGDPFSLTTLIASDKNPPPAGDAFWSGFSGVACKCFSAAAANNDVDAGYSYAKTVCDIAAIKETLDALAQTAVRGPTPIGRLAVNAALYLARNAVFTGGFDELQEIAGKLEAVHGINPHIVDRRAVLEMRQLLFEQAYIRGDAGLMKKIHDEQLATERDLPPNERAVMQMKLAFKENNYQEVYRLFADNQPLLVELNQKHAARHRGAPHPAVMEAYRLAHLRCPYEDLRAQALKRAAGEGHFDEDVWMNPAVFTPEETAQLFELQKRAEQLHAVLQKYPLALNRYAELSLQEQRARLTALLQVDSGKAAPLFNESWRLANQLGVSTQAVLSKKVEGDLHMLAGISVPTKYPTEGEAGELAPRTVFDRGSILKAIKAYKIGKRSLGRVAGNHIFHLILRGQMMRAVGALCQSYGSEFSGSVGPERLVQIKRELLPYIQEAMADAESVNVNWGTAASDPEAACCIGGPMGHILKTMQVLGLELPRDLSNEKAWPYLASSTLDAGDQYVAKVVDMGIGEKQRKEAGLRAAREIKRNSAA